MNDPTNNPTTWRTAPGWPGWPYNLRRDPAGPITANAVVALVQARARKPVGDAIENLQALVDLIAACQASIPDAVADARDQYHPWEHIAAVLAISPNTAERRYNRHCHTRRSPMDLA